MDSKDFDRITPKDIIGGTFYSDGKKDESMGINVGPGTNPQELIGKILANGDKIMGAVSIGPNGVNINGMGTGADSDPAQLLMLLSTGMGMATAAMAALENGGKLTKKEAAAFHKAADDLIYPNYKTVMARCFKEHKKTCKNCREGKEHKD